MEKTLKLKRSLRTIATTLSVLVLSTPLMSAPVFSAPVSYGTQQQAKTPVVSYASLKVNLSNPKAEPGMNSVVISVTVNKPSDLILEIRDSQQKVIATRNLKVARSGTAKFASVSNLEPNTAYTYYVKQKDKPTNLVARAFKTLKDTIKPTVSILNPKSGSTLNGKVDLKVDAQDNFKVAKVNYYLDDKFLGSSVQSPFGLVWDTAKTSNGIHVLKAIAYDPAGNTAEHKIELTVKNSSTTNPREVKLTNPQVTSETITARDSRGTLLWKGIAQVSDGFPRTAAITQYKADGAAIESFTELDYANVAFNETQDIVSGFLRFSTYVSPVKSSEERIMNGTIEFKNGKAVIAKVSFYEHGQLVETKETTHIEMLDISAQPGLALAAGLSLEAAGLQSGDSIEVQKSGETYAHMTCQGGRCMANLAPLKSGAETIVDFNVKNKNNEPVSGKAQLKFRTPKIYMGELIF